MGDALPSYTQTHKPRQIPSGAYLTLDGVMKEANHGMCRLCGAKSQLRNSHVLPEFLYKDLYDDKGRMFGLKPTPGARPDYLQKGLRERLLCPSCETRLSKYETYAASVLRRFPDTSSEKPGAVVQVTGVEYSTFKLFQMSLLWRAGVATQGSFSQVNLGPHQEPLRKMIFGNNPGRPLDYPCLLVRLRGPGDIKQIMTMPQRDRFSGHRSYQMILQGTLWMFFVSGHSDELRETGSMLSESGVLPIHVATETGKEFLSGLAAHMKEEGLL